MFIASTLQQKRFLILGIISFVIIVLLTILLVYYATREPDTIEVTPTTPVSTTPVPTTPTPPVKTSDSISGVTIFLLVVAIIIALLSVLYIYFRTSSNPPKFLRGLSTKPLTRTKGAFTKP